MHSQVGVVIGNVTNFIHLQPTGDAAQNGRAFVMGQVVARLGIEFSEDPINRFCAIFYLWAIFCFSIFYDRFRFGN